MNTTNILNPDVEPAGQQRIKGRPGKFITRRALWLLIVMALVVVALMAYAFHYRYTLQERRMQHVSEASLNRKGDTSAVHELADGFARGIKSAQAHITPGQVIIEAPLPETTPEPIEPEWKKNLRHKRYEKFIASLAAPKHSGVETPTNSLASGAPSGTAAGNGATAGLLNQIRQQIGGAVTSGGVPGANQDQNRQGIKNAFLNDPLDHNVVDPNISLPPPARYYISTTQMIPAMTIFEVNSDLPGKFKVQVAEDIRDYRTGNHILIPQGTNVLFDYSSRVAFGQKRVAVKAERLVFPNGEHRELGDSGFVGIDQKGSSGVKDKVNHHFLRIFGSALVLAVVTAGLESATDDDNFLDDDFGDEFSESTAEVMARVVEQMTARNLNIQPTLQIRPGKRVNIFVTQDMLFDRPYRHYRG